MTRKRSSFPSRSIHQKSSTLVLQTEVLRELGIK